MTLLTFPTAVPSPTRQRWRLISNTGLFPTKPIHQMESVGYDGALWACEATWSNMKPAVWRPFSSFLAQLRGVSGRFYYGPLMAKLQQSGSGPGFGSFAPVWSKGATSMVLYGVTPGQIPCQAGDYFTVETEWGYELKICSSTPSNADNTGATTLYFEPPAHASTYLGAAGPNFLSPTALMGLAGPNEGGSDDNGTMEFGIGVNASVTLQLIERIPSQAVM